MSDWEKKLFPKQSLIAGALATGIGVFMTGSETVGGVANAALVMGLPTIAGADVAHLAQKEWSDLGGDSITDYVFNGAIAGATAAGILMAIGQLPEGLSAETMTVFLVSGGSVALSKMLIKDL